jgi:flagellar basal-body rod protein FlgC
MNYFSAFEISASGMAFERLRLDVTAMNLANANSVRDAQGNLYQPVRVVGKAGRSFGNYLQQAVVPHIAAAAQAPRLVHEPNHPLAGAQGFIAMPNVNPVDEMLNLVTAVRGYEANVRAMNAARTMALRALEIGAR